MVVEGGRVGLRGAARPLRVGHRGAAAVAPENTLASLRAAVEAGLDVVEFDVLALADGTLALGHSPGELPAERLSLADALAYLAGTPCGLHVDVKGLGFEHRVVEALRRHGVEERAIISSTRGACLRRFAGLAPGLPRALSYPDDRLGLSSRLPAAVVDAGLASLRRLLPRRVGTMLRRAGATIASLNDAVVTRATVERCHELGVPVIAWTVDDPERVRELAELGVDAVVSNDPAALLATLPA